MKRRPCGCAQHLFPPNHHVLRACLMAYNREWDQGKDTWAANGQWDDGSSSGNVRERDDDYYGEGKRRKFNDGVRSARAGP